jgi:hypothetical protein
MPKLLFDVGDIIKTRHGKGQIVALRNAVGNTRTGHMFPVADVLTADGKVRATFLHDLARDNPDKLKVLA